MVTADKVKKLFLLSCFTGLRFSDVTRLSKGNIQNDTIIIRARKTDKKRVGDLRIPLLAPAKAILTEIGFDVKKIILSNQKANRYLKQLLKAVGIDTPIKTYSYPLNGDRTEADKPKWEIATFQCGRDTFITNCLIGDAEIMTVMSWSGHKKFDTFKKYVKLPDSYKKVQHKKADKFFSFANKPINRSSEIDKLADQINDFL